MLITAIIARIHRNGFMKNIFHSHAKVVLVILISFLGQGLHGQTFLGHIFGTTVGGHKGVSVSMPDAYTVAIGGDGGDVRIYSWNGISGWVKKGLDINGQASNDKFGRSVSMSDSNTVAVGANKCDFWSQGNIGCVGIYSWNGNSWLSKGQVIYGESNSDESGYSVSLPDSNTIAIGARYNDGNGHNAGHVRIYSWDGSSWIQKGTDIDGEATNDLSGYSVSMPDASTVAIGAPANDGNGIDAGHVRIYTWNGISWIKKGFDIDGKANYDYAGYSVSMPDASTVAIGARSKYGINRKGKTRIYSWSGSNWLQKGLDIEGEANDDLSGYSVSMPNANTVAIGAPANDGKAYAAGHVRIYTWNGSNWMQKGLDIEGEAQDDNAGYSVSMPDSITVAIGAPNNDGSGVSNAGQVRIFNLPFIPKGGVVNSRGCIECDTLSIGDYFRINDEIILVVNRSMLDSLIAGGHDLTKVCVSHITDMSFAFDNQATFNQDIGNWDVSHVTTMNKMFFKAKDFNQNIGNWDVASVLDMSRMFQRAEDFNQDLSRWCVGSIYSAPVSFSEYASLLAHYEPQWGLCSQASLDNNGCLECDSLSIGDFFVYKGDSIEVVDRQRLDQLIALQADLTKVCVSHVTTMKNLFRGQVGFNQNISSWDVSNVTNMNRMFKKASNFSQDISKWDVSNVNRMNSMFESSSAFNHDLSDWCVRAFQYQPPVNFALNSALVADHHPKWGNCPQDFSNVRSLTTGAFVNSAGCVDCSALNIGDYFELGGDTLLVVDRSMLDSLVLLHDDLSKVCVSNITDMADALRGLSWFNTDISKWDVSNVTDMSNMFWKARTFNQDIGNWDVSNVSRMNRMFKVAKAFNHDIGSWDVSNVERFQEMFRNADAFNQAIGGWDVSSVLDYIQMTSMFRSADSFSQDLSSWCVYNVSSKPSGFEVNSSLTANQLPVWGTCPIPIPTGGYFNSSGCVECDSLNIGDYFRINGDTMLVVNRTMLDSMVTGGYDVTKVCVSNITDMSNVFMAQYSFNQNISQWDVSNVINMSGMFDEVWSFSQDIGNWDVSNVMNMSGMFAFSDINQDISGWDVSNVTNMSNMFFDSGFNVDIGGWDVSSVTNMHSMFWDASSFNQDLSNWCVSSIPSKPNNFDSNSALTSANLPQWGTCPVPPIVRIKGNDATTSYEVNRDNPAVQVKLQEITLFPNPTTGIVKISPLVEGTYRIYNEVGRTIDAGQIKETFDFSNQSNGIYMLVLQTDNGILYRKVVKQ